MLEQYIRNYFLDLGLKSQYVEELSPQDDGSYLMLFDARLVCSAQEQHHGNTAVFVFSIVLNTKELETGKLPEKFAYYSSRLNRTPLAGRACLFTVLPENHIGLMYTISSEGLEQQDFNRAVNLLSRTVIFIEGSRDISPPPQDDELKDITGKYHRLLDALNISVEDLRRNFNRLVLKNGFGVLLEFHPNAAVLKLVNVLPDTLSEESVLALLSFNSEQAAGRQFNYQAGRLFLEQSIDLKNTDPDRLSVAVERQRMLLEALNQEFTANPSREENSIYNITDMLSNLTA